MSIRKEDFGTRPLENGTANSGVMQGRPSPTISPKRLPSFKPPRDLTLGLPKTLSLSSKPKKKFAPNVATRRNKSNESSDIKSGDDHSRPGSRGKRGKWENRGGGRGGQRNRVFIQTTGSVFGEGIGEPTKRYQTNDYHSHSREGSGGSNLTKTRLNLEHHEKIDKKEEDLKLEALMSCNFVDDPSIAPDESFRPIALPLIKERKKIKKEPVDDKIKLEGIKEEDDKGLLKIKTEPGWESSSCTSIKNCMDDEVVVKVEPGSEEEVKLHPKPKEAVRTIYQERGLNEYSVLELIEHSKKGYILFQLPTCLPGPKPEVEPSGKPSKGQENQSTAPEAQASMDDVSEQLEDCTLSALPEGHLGTLRIYESGRSEVCLNGGYSLVVNPGTQVGFLQELVSVDLNESSSSGKMVVMGPICSTLNCTPDLEKMILAAEDGNS